MDAAFGFQLLDIGKRGEILASDAIDGKTASRCFASQGTR
jgi:hypothetical protein